MALKFRKEIPNHRNMYFVGLQRSELPEMGW